MPELPEVEVLRRSLEPALLGDRVERVVVRNPDLREPVRGRALARAMVGRAVVGLRRRGKYLLVDVEAGRTLVVAGDPDASFLLDKLRGDLAAGEGRRMPYGGAELGDEEIGVIEEWIASGADAD